MQIDNKIYEALKANDITVDMLGQPLEVGSIILVKGYGSNDHDMVGKVKRINKVNLVVDIEKRYTTWGDYDTKGSRHLPFGQPGSVYPNYKIRTELVEMSRKPYDVIRFEAQKENADREFDQLMHKHPEAFV